MERVAGRLQELSRFARLPPVGSSQNFGGHEVGTLRLCCTSQNSSERCSDLSRLSRCAWPEWRDAGEGDGGGEGEASSSTDRYI